MAYFLLLSLTKVLYAAHNLTPLERDDWNASRVWLSQARPRRTHRRSRPWNKHVSTWSRVYYASIHSHNTL